MSTSEAAVSQLALPRSTLVEQGVDPEAVGRLLDALAAADLELHSLMVLRHGHVVVEGWWAPYRPDGLHLLYSLSKSFTSTAVGLAVEEGLLSVDDLVTSFFPDLVPADADPRLMRMKVRHLLSMSTGHRQDTLERLDRHNLVASFLAQPVDEEPGTWFTYNQGATATLSAIVTLLSGQRLLDYLRPRLLEPLGVAEAYWQGVDELDLGFTGLHLTTESVAKFGQLYLQRGRWQGRQLVPESWVAEATRPHVDNPREPNPDWRQGYGYQFWMGRHGYRGDGAFGQFCLVLPEQDLVVATTAATEDMQAVLDRVHSELLPGCEVQPARDTDTDTDTGLSGRLRQLALPCAQGDDRGLVVALPWSAPPGSAAGVRVLSIDVDGAGWRLTFTDERAVYDVRCGDGTLVESTSEVEPRARLRVAASGAWRGGSTFVAEVALVETPHRLTLVFDCATGSTTAGWNVAPLGPVTVADLALEWGRF